MRLVEKQDPQNRTFLVGRTTKCKWFRICSSVRLQRMYWRETRERTFIRGLVQLNHYQQLYTFMQQHSKDYYFQLYFRCQKKTFYGKKKVYWRLIESNYSHRWLALSEERLASSRDQLDQQVWTQLTRVFLPTKQYNTSTYGFYPVMFTLASKNFRVDGEPSDMDQIEQGLKSIPTSQITL